MKSILEKAKSAHASKPSLFARELEDNSFTVKRGLSKDYDVVQIIDIRKAQQKALQEFERKVMENKGMAHYSIILRWSKECFGEVKK